MSETFKNHFILKPGTIIIPGDEYENYAGLWKVTSLCGSHVPDPAKKNPCFRYRRLNKFKHLSELCTASCCTSNQ